MDSSKSIVVAAVIVIILVIWSMRSKRPTRSGRTSGGQEASCRIVSSRGILHSCQVKSSDPVSSTKSINLTRQLLSSLCGNETVFVCTTALPSLVPLLSSLKKPIRLVTGDADETVDDSNIYTTIANHPMISKWFAQNASLVHPKIRQIPIGLDYHTLSTKSMWGEPVTSPLD